MYISYFKYQLKNIFKIADPIAKTVH